jgi:hypothetical protein
MPLPAEFSWLTELEIQIAYGDYPDAPPHEVFLLQVVSPDLKGRPWDDDAVVAELEPLTWVESGNGSPHQLPYELSVRKGHFSWGADGATAGLSLYIAQHLIEGGLGAAGGAAVMMALKRVRDRVRPRTTAESFLRTPAELAEYGRWSVSAAYRQWLPEDDPLPLVEEQWAEDEWTGTFQDDTGNEYTVTLRPREGQPYRVRISRRATRGG